MKLEEKKLPKGWEVKKLGEVCKLKNGFAFKSNNYQKNGVPVIRISDISSGIVSSEDAVRVEARDDYENYLVETNDILVAMSGATTGKFGIFKSTEKAYQNQRVGKFKILDEKILNNQFLFYQINSLKKQIEKDSYGGAQPNISSVKIEQMEITLPPLPEQQAIVAKIEELFSELENGKKELLTAQAKLKTYRQSLLKWAFEGRLTNENLKEGELPKGWEVKKLGEVAKNKSKKVTPADYPDAKFVGMDCIEPHTLKPKFTYKFGDFKSAGNYFEMGQVLYGRMRPYLNKVYKAEYEGACSGEFIVLQCSEKLYPNLLSYILHSKDFVSYANHKTNGDRPRISYEEISDYPIALGPLHEQQAIVAILESKLTICDKIEEATTASLKQAETLRQSILKKAFEGKLINKKNVT
jgi:type I restriction enzyme S subunit